MKRIATVLTLLAGCGAGQKDIVPRLPADGTAHTAVPREAGKEGGDQWTGKDLIDAPRPAAPRLLSLPPLERFTLPNGLEVIAVESDAAATVQVQLAVRAGRRDEVRDKVGLASFVAAMLTRGARGKTEAQMTAAMEQAGAELRADASYEAILLGCHAPDSGQAACIDAVAGIAMAPSFPAAGIDEVKKQLQSTARQSHADPSQLASLHFQNALWGEEHVRGWPMSERTVSAIQRADLVAWHKARFTPKNAVLLVVSSQKAAALRPLLQRAFGAWRGGAVEPTATGEASSRGIHIRLVDVPGSPQAHVRVGRAGIAHRDADFLAATVVNHVLGGDDDRSRLGRGVRKALGGRGAASSSFDRNLDRGAFVAAAVAPGAQAVAVMRVLMEEIGRMQADGPTDEEVTAAVNALAGGYQTRFESHQELASALLAAQLHGLKEDYVRAFAVDLAKVTPAAARASAGRWLDAKNLVVVLAGNAQEIEPQLVEAGLKFERMSQSQPVTLHEREAIEKAAKAPPDPKKEAEARKVLEAALIAKGGADKLAAVKTLSWKGKATLNLPAGKVPAQVEKRFVAPEKLRLDMVIEMGGAKVSITTALAGDQGWAQEIRPAEGGKVESRVIDFPKSEIEAGKAQIWRDQDFVLLRHREKGSVVAPQEDVDLDGASHHAIRVTAADGKRTVVLLIDKKTRRLGGMTYAEQGLSAEERYGDYKAISGIQVAHTRMTKSAQVDLTTTVTEVKIDPKIDESIFAKPK